MPDRCKHDVPLTRTCEKCERAKARVCGIPYREKPEPQPDVPFDPLDRATQALKDAAVAYSVATNATPVDAKFYAARLRLTRAAEDYAEAYLRG